jgi:hypothetical protein
MGMQPILQNGQVLLLVGAAEHMIAHTLEEDVADHMTGNSLVNSVQDVDHDAIEAEALNLREQNRNLLAIRGTLEKERLMGAAGVPPGRTCTASSEAERAVCTG